MSGQTTHDERAFRNLLLNTLISGVTSSFLWFALTFWVYLETESVTAMGVIGGSYGISMALLGPTFGTFVDRHRKHSAMLLATAVSASCFALATVVFVAVDTGRLLQLDRPFFWLLTLLILGGSVAGMLRSIALSTCVTLLVPEERRDRANGMVGTVNGVSFAITSVFSGLVIGQLGMGWALYGSLVLTVACFVHLATIHIGEAEPEPPAEGESTGHVDVRGALEAIRAVPGLGMLIGLAAVNNLLGGVFMALMDAYGLSLVSVETWGFLWGFLSTGFIVGGLVIAKVGLGSTPVRLIIVFNLVNWVVCSLFTIQSSVVLLTIGTYVWILLMPAVEAAEQTVLQRSIPFERQGRVFGFAQLVENAASPVTAFAIAPLTQGIFMPFMSRGSGADWIGSWYGTGPERGIALVFTLAGVLGVVITLVAWRSRSYRRLTARADAPAADVAPAVT